MIFILTGGIASGKSTIAKLFEESGANIIDTDDIAKELVEVGSEYLKAIAEYFGDGILNEDKTLNRDALKKRIFENEDDKLWLESLLHPAIQVRAYQKANQSDAKLNIIVVPLLKSKKDYPADRIISIECDPETQIQRVMSRDNISREMALKIIKSQPSRETREKLADVVFYNDGEIEDLKKQFQF